MSKDFVYVLKNGTVIEQGYRADLERSEGEFKAMKGSQAITAASMADDKERPESAMEDEEKDSLPQPLSYAPATLMPTTAPYLATGCLTWTLMLKGSGPMPFCLAVLAASFLPTCSQSSTERWQWYSSIQITPTFPPSLLRLSPFYAINTSEKVLQKVTAR
ncbi:uncharacterized protein ARMOST_19391 [Armillaria ostoyae]|uniref:Uncharacterized protein n=1 Tax=Armillaria ostoyae TaxID=47428 RepID=A0A284S4E5_ARMOS|nr:uncharacterized protein ARMOST_19391 [Armillaria ostoyae]